MSTIILKSVNLWEILLWQTACNELIDMTGSLRETFSNPTLFSVRDRSPAPERNDKLSRSQFRDMLQDSGSSLRKRQSTETKSVRDAQPKLAANPKVQESSIFASDPNAQPQSIKRTEGHSGPEALKDPLAFVQPIENRGEWSAICYDTPALITAAVPYRKPNR